jgi:hypothetical protein
MNTDAAVMAASIQSSRLMALSFAAQSASCSARSLAMTLPTPGRGPGLFKILAVSATQLT